MAQTLKFPDKYHVVWLDDHIGEADFCLQLKRVFFSNVDGSNDNAVSWTDGDINNKISFQSEIPVQFDSFHFTLNAFKEEESCLKYIDEIKNDRILFITSSMLGESAVGKLLDRYIGSFTNARTEEPYDSIYVFCTDVERAAQWARPYRKYVKIFDFEADLLARMTRDLAEQFLEHGKLLLAADQLEEAEKRLWWAKSLFMRHEQLCFREILQEKSPQPGVPKNSEKSKENQPQPQAFRAPKLSRELQAVERWLTGIDDRLQQEQHKDSDDDEAVLAQSISQLAISSTIDHQIVWVDEWIDSSKQDETSSVYDGARFRKDITKQLDALEKATRECFPDLPASVKTFEDADLCYQHITDSKDTHTTFLIMSSSFARTLLPNLMRGWSFLQRIYVLGNHFAIPSDLIEQYHTSGVQLLLFDLCDNLVIRLLQDLSTYYASKGVDRRSNASPLDISTLGYFDWAKAAVTQANQLAENSYEDARKEIEKEERKTQSLIKQRQLSVSGIIQQLQIYNQTASLDSVVIIFVYGLETNLIELDWSIGYVVSCTTAAQLETGLMSVEPSTPAIVVSSSSPSDELLSRPLLLHYYYFSSNQDAKLSKLLTHQNLSHVCSVDLLISELYHKLAQHYREDAIQAAFELRDQQKAQRLLQKSTQCYKQLEEDTAKTLQRYAELLKRIPVWDK